MSEVKEGQAPLESIRTSVLAFEEVFNQSVSTEEEYMQRDKNLKTRVHNMITNFSSRYNVPDILQLTNEEEGSDFFFSLPQINSPHRNTPQEVYNALLPTRHISASEKKEQGRKYLYFKTKEKKVVTGFYVPGLLKIIKPRIDFEKEVNVDGNWNLIGKMIQFKLLDFMPSQELLTLASIWGLDKIKIEYLGSKQDKI